VSALDALTDTYHYHSTVAIGGSVVLSADGDRVGDGTRVGVERQGAVVQYVITAAGTWVQVGDDEWDELDAPPAASDPIDALRSPTSFTITSADATATTLDVAVPLVALGIAGDGGAVLSVTVANGVLSSVTYSTTIEGQPATVVTEFGPVVDGSPVVAPA
jgi:hypothetical protein